MQRVYGFHVRGAAVEVEDDYVYSLCTITYSQTYTVNSHAERPSIDKMWADFKRAYGGYTVGVESAYLSILMERPISLRESSLTSRQIELTIPLYLQFDGNLEHNG